MPDPLRMMGDLLRKAGAVNVPVTPLEPADLVGIPTIKPRPAGRTEPMFEAPNLDGLSNDPDDLRAASDVLMNLALYAEFKANAMTNRLAGNIPAALKFEKGCDSIYQTLPPWARW